MTPAAQMVLLQASLTCLSNPPFYYCSNYHKKQKKQVRFALSTATNRKRIKGSTKIAFEIPDIPKPPPYKKPKAFQRRNANDAAPSCMGPPLAPSHAPPPTGPSTTTAAPGAGETPAPQPRDRYNDGTFITYLATPREVHVISINPSAYRVGDLDTYTRVIETSIANISAFGQRACIQEFRWENSPSGLVPRLTTAQSRFEYFYKLVSVHYITDEMLLAMFGAKTMDEFSWVDRGEGFAWFVRDGYERYVGLDKVELTAAVLMWWGRGMEAEFGGIKAEMLVGPQLRCVEYLDGGKIEALQSLAREK